MRGDSDPWDLEDDLRCRRNGRIALNGSPCNGLPMKTIAFGRDQAQDRKAQGLCPSRFSLE